jgi:hypothetical protein
VNNDPVCWEWTCHGAITPRALGVEDEAMSECHLVLLGFTLIAEKYTGLGYHGSVDFIFPSLQF